MAQIDAQLIRIFLAQGQVEEALRLSRGSPSDRAPAELQLARLETIVAAYTRQPAGSDTEKLAGELIAVMNNLAASSPSWRRCAELVATPAALHEPTLAKAASPELLSLRSIREGKIDDAISAYDRAVSEAKQVKNPDRLFAATRAAARLEADEGRLDAASQRCRGVAIENPKHEQAAATHLWAIEYARQKLLAEKSPPDLLEDFHKLLAEHIERWPNDTADAVKSLQKQLVN